MKVKGHLLYYPEGKHDINLGNYVLKSQLNDALKSKVDSITKTTYANLKNLRDNSQLTPGSLYRITDYQCTTTQENTRSADHQFDIVLLALSENKLAEEGWAMMHDNIYDVTFSDGVTKKCWLYEEPDSVSLVDYNTHNGGLFALEDIIINEVDKTVDATDFDYDECMTETNLPYNYFQNSNLSAWKVWYCLDNDKSRFAWADDSVDLSVTINDNYIRYEELDASDKFSWHDTSKDIIFTDSETPAIGDNIYVWDRMRKIFMERGTVQNVETLGTGLPNGRGVIYRLIDEWNNDCPYDFKNIQFLVENNWLYTMSNYGLPGDEIDVSVSYHGSVTNNYISKQINVDEGGEILGENIISFCMGCSVIGVNSRNNIVARGNTTLINCTKTMSVNGDSILIDCSEFTPEESGYYLVNKKVLTES